MTWIKTIVSNIPNLAGEDVLKSNISCAYLGKKKEITSVAALHMF